MVFDAPGVVNEYVGGYEDWLRQRPSPEEKISTSKNVAKPIVVKEKPKLDQQQQKELKTLPAKIERLENKVAEIQAQFAEPGFFQQEEKKVLEVQESLKKYETELQGLYARWEALEDT